MLTGRDSKTLSEASKGEAFSLRKQLLFGAVIALLTVVLAVGLLEIYVRVFTPTLDLYQLTGRVAAYNPMSRWGVVDAFCAYRMKPGQIAEGKTVNKDGFISTPEVTPQKAKGALRVVFLGESSTAGVGGKILKDTETWPWQTVEMIRQRLPVEVDFINGAAGGYTSFESYGRLWSRIRHFSPDVVVICHGWNELYYFDDADQIASWRTLPDGSWSFTAFTEPISIYSQHWADPVLRWSQVLTRVRLRLSDAEAGEVGPRHTRLLKPDFNHAGPSIWRTNLRLFSATCSVIKARLLVAKQATLIVPGLSPEQRRRCRYHLHGLEHDAIVRAFREIYQVIDEEIPRDSVVDLSMLSGRPEYFSDHIHPSVAGCREIASLMAEELVKHIRPEASRPRDGSGEDNPDPIR